MIRLHPRSFPFLPILCLSAQPAMAQMDEVRPPLLRAFPTALRWDNVESLPSWCGARRFSHTGGMHALWLEPGQAVYLPAPPGAWLRVRPLEGQVLDRLEVGTTDGAGLVARAVDRRSPGTPDALFGPAGDQPILWRLRCPEGGSRMRVALFLSRREEAGDLPPYLHEVRFPGPTVRLSSPLRPGSDTWQTLDPGQARSLKVSGPARLQIQAHLYLGPQEPAPQGTWTLDWTWEKGGKHTKGETESVTFQGGSEGHQPFYVNGRPAHLGQLESAFIDVPAGQHTLAFRTSPRAILRITRHRRGDVLFAGLNGLHPALADLPKEPQSENARLSALWQKALDPRQAEAGLVAWATFSRWVEALPDRGDLQRQKQRLTGAVTAFRDLLPREEPAGGALRAVAFLPELNAHPRAPRSRVAFPGDGQETLSGLTQAPFLRLGKGLSFDLPPPGRCLRRSGSWWTGPRSLRAPASA